MKKLILLTFFYFIFSLIASAEAKSIEDIKSTPTFHQKSEGFLISLTPEEMDFLLNNLPYATTLLNKYEIHTIQIIPDAGKYRVEDSNGLKGTFWLVQKNFSSRIYKGYGSIDSKIVGKFSADVVATIDYKYFSHELITNDLELWVLVSNSFLDFLCRIFRPFLKGILKNKLEGFINSAQKLADNVRTDNILLI